MKSMAESAAQFTPTASPGSLRPIQWLGDLCGTVDMIDQTRLPAEHVILHCRDVQSVFEAIRRLSIRGAPAIGIAAAMGTVLGIRDYEGDLEGFRLHLRKTCEYLAGARPTAVNLFWALNRMQNRAEEILRPAENTAQPVRTDLPQLKHLLLQEALDIRDEDAAMCRAIGDAGWELIPDGGAVLTHCNAGALATAEYGTALAVMYTAQARGRRFKVYVDETRPLLQGARLTAWELNQAGIEVVLICDSAAAHVMKQGVDLVITGADRIASNGDSANKIGTYSLAIAAKEHDVPFYIAAPHTTFDPAIPDGSHIPIEERSADEVRSGWGHSTAPSGVACYNPAFDVTPARLIRGLITDHGLMAPITIQKIADMLSQAMPAIKSTP